MNEESLPTVPAMSNSSDLLPIVYDRLRNFAKSRFNQNDSLFGTELVHEAYLRVADDEKQWESQAHFFGAVRKAMRNAIVDHIRQKKAVKNGGKHQRLSLEAADVDKHSVLPRIVALSDALDKLAKHDSRAANVVTLRFFACMTEQEACQELGISRRTASRDWTYARAWLRRELEK